MRLNNKGVRSHVSAVATADADRLIHPDRLVSEFTTKDRLEAGLGVIELDGSLISRRWIGGWRHRPDRRGQASQRVTTSSMDPS